MTLVAAHRWFLITAAAGTFALACSAKPENRSLLLVTIDTLRADRLALGSGDSTGPMPRLRSLAARGSAFSRAYCQTPLTVPSHATLLTGLDARHHGVRDNLGYTLAPGTPTLAMLLAARGFRCAAFIGGYPLAGRADLAQGFERYDDRMTRPAGGGNGKPTERRATEVVEAALSWLNTLAPRSRFFAWVHLYDAHNPYEAPPGWAKIGESAYDAEVRYADAALGRLLDEAGSRGWLDGTLVVVASDHGEMLGERGERTHGIFLYESALRVPLVVVSPAGKAGAVIDRPTPLIDLAPTILELLEVAPPARLDGDSLAAVIRGDGPAPPPREFYVESLHPRRRYGWSPLFAAIDWPMKYIEAPEPELYDVRADPEESRNLASTGRALRLREKLTRMRSAGQAAASSEAIDEERRAILGSLGYTGAASGAGSREALEDRPRADPKRRIAALPMLQEGLDKVAAGEAKAAARALDAALTLDPDDLLALHNRGIVAMMQGRPAEAERWLRRASSSDPFSDNVLNDLGLALTRLGRSAEAVSAYRGALRVNPGFVPARFNLGVALLRSGRSAEALQELRRVESADHGFPGLAAALGAAQVAHDESRPPR